LSRVRDSLLCLSAAAGTQQHTIYHGMARLQELHSTLKSLTAHYQAQQQQLHQQQQQQEKEREKERRQRESGASSAAAAAEASAAAAAAISGLGGGAQQQQSDRRARQGKQQHGKLQRGQQLQQQQQDGARASSPTPGEQTKLRSRQAALVTAEGQTGSTNSSSSSSSQSPALQEQQKALGQDFQASLLRLAAPVLSTLVLLVDALLQQGEASSIAGLQAWVHSSFHATWRAVSKFYALDLSLDLDSSGVGLGSGQTEPQSDWDPAAGAAQNNTRSTQVLLAWMCAAAAQAEGRYEEALQLHAAFLQSDACSIPLGSCLRGFVVEQMAACYAAVGNWQGLTGLSSSSRRGVHTLQDQQHQQQEFPARHWTLAGAAGVAALQQWQHASGQRRQQQQHGQRQLPGSSHQQLDASQLPGLTSAAQTILSTVAALQVASASSSTSPVSQLQQLQQQQPLHVGAVHQQQQQQQRQQQLPVLLAEVQAQLQQLSSPQYLTKSTSSSSSGDVHHWQQLAVLQLLQAALSAQLFAQQAEPTADLHAGLAKLLQMLPRLQHSREVWCSVSRSSSCCWDGALRSDGQLQSSCFGDVQLAMPLVQVRRCCIGFVCVQVHQTYAVCCVLPHETYEGNVNCFVSVWLLSGVFLLAVAQVVAAAASLPNSSTSTQQSLKLLLREALLASHASNCTSMQQRLLGLADAACCSSGDERLWLTLLRSKLSLPAGCSSNEACQEAVVAHVALLRNHGAFIPPSSHRSSSSDSTCQPAALAAAYLSLSELLAASATSSGSAALDAAAAASIPSSVHGVDWQAVHRSSLTQLLPGAQHVTESKCSVLDASQCAAAADVVPAGYIPAAACCAAAVAAAPAAAEPWKAYGDLLYCLAGMLEQQQQQQHQDRGHLRLLAASAEAYCNYLAAAVNAKALASPEQGLGVLLRLLETILQHGEALQPQLQQALGSCPAAAWQVLTPQLLGQLQHASAAVRALVQQLLQGLALVVPCSVLYPLIVEVRAAQEAGQEVSALGQHCRTPHAARPAAVVSEFIMHGMDLVV
jgi:hypothetical protein